MVSRTDISHSGLTASIPGGDEAGGAHTPGPGPIWSCKIGVTGALALPAGCDGPMRRAVDDAFQRLTGRQPEFIFSGWSATLTEPELAVVENRWPSEEHYAAERVRDAAPELLDALQGLLHYCEQGATNTRLLDAALDRSRSAIAKAVGDVKRDADPVHRRDGGAESVGVTQANSKTQPQKPA